VKVRLTLGAVAATAMVLAGVTMAAGGQATSATAHLTPGQEVPKQAVKVTDASGTFSATLKKTAKGYSMRWRLTFKNLSGRQAWSYLHKGKAGKFGAALYILCKHCSSGVTGTVYVSPWAFHLMQSGLTYINVRTTANPAGEIRGQIVIQG
jgi:hypothetical protein